MVEKPRTPYPYGGDRVTDSVLNDGVCSDETADMVFDFVANSIGYLAKLIKRLGKYLKPEPLK